MTTKQATTPIIRKAANAAVMAGLILACSSQPAFATPSPIALSNIPMVLVQPAHPQVLFLLGNSQSMDGNLSGAIMTGASGTYTVPSGFTAPVSGTVGDGTTTTASYTAACGGNQCDNSDSRLNVAKAAITATINQYASITDFGLMDFKTGSVGRYTTWVYYMSKTGGFTFTDTNGSDTVANPCYGSTSGACSAIATHYGNTDATTKQYLVIANTSDNPAINDVLYAGGGLPDNFVTYTGPYKGYNYAAGTVASPYPPVYSLTDYNNGNILLGYRYGTSGTNGFATGPTNAGYVPYSDEVFYSKRGFGYYASPSNLGQLLVGVGQNTISAFSSHLQPETNSTSTSEIKSVAVNATIASLLREANRYYGGTNGYTAPVSNNGCSTKRYAILVTDGLPTVDLAGKYWPPLGSEAATGYGVTATIDSTTNPAFPILTNTNNQAVNDAIDQIAALQAAGITTYVVGMGAGVDPTKNPAAAATLEALARAGSPASSPNDYFKATSPADVASQLSVILAHIQSAQMATTSAAVDSTTLNTTNQVFQSRFDSTNWSGNIYAFKIDTTTGQVNTDPTNSANYYWDAQSKVDAQGTSRTIVTWNPAEGAGVPFRWDSTHPTASISPAQHDLLANATDPTPSATVDWAVDRLNYIRGDTSNDGTGDNFRDRQGVLLGDIVDSNPLFIGAPNGPYPDASYQTFEASKKNRTPMLYVGANDGMLHAFNADATDATNQGKEVFAYVPNGVFANLKNLTDPNYNLGHRFYVDGSPSAGDALFSDSSWHTVLMGGLNNGGNSIYALDITNPPTSPTSLTEAQMAAKVLWEFTDGDMGQSYSRPVLARVAHTDSGTQFVAVFGSGYNNSTQKPFLYFLNAETGAVVKKIDLCGSVSGACDSSLPNGLSGPVVVAPQGDGMVTTVYAGDLQGNMWKVDVSNTNLNQWDVSRIFAAVDSGGTRQPITTVPSVSLHPAFPTKTGYLVYFGTGRFLGATDLPASGVTPQTQTFYGIWDNPSNNTPPTRSDLVQQTYTQSTYTAPTGTTLNGTASVDVRLGTGNTVNWTTKQGWYMDFTVPANSGERIITDSRLSGGRIIFTTYTPSTDTCNGGGSSWLMTLDYSNGGQFAEPELDLNFDATLNSDDQVSNRNPTGVSLGNGFASAPTLVKTKNPPGDRKLISTSTGEIHSVLERGGSLQGRMSWRPIQIQ